ncbi:hypothetical protein [Dinoroseobacter sp. S124A]|uniref:hypothetical protein n=1 Tax=Dinoroseobacter sp. S124A TaxID=3415128 RepID=UPI003C7C1570
MGHHITRRSLLASLPAVAAVPASAAPGTPVMRRYRVWLAHYDHLSSPEALCLPNDPFDQMCQDSSDRAKALIDTRSESATDMLAKLMAFTENGEDLIQDGNDRSKALVEEARATLARELA